MKSRAIATMLLTSLTIVFSSQTTTLAQSASSKTPAGKAEPRFFQQFVTDAAIVDKQWYSGEVRLERGAVPPIENADGFTLTPIIAISPITNLEVGGKVSYIDYRLDHRITINNGSTSFKGESGLGDLTLWGKYRLLEGSVALSVGGTLDLPTGSESDGLGTGKVVPAVFGAFRTRVGDGSVMGEAGFRFNRSATLVDTGFRGKTSTFLGGGYVWEPVEDLAVSGEVTVESERFKDASSDFRATAGAQWLGVAHSVFRGAVAIGLSNGAPDFELILGYAYTF